MVEHSSRRSRVAARWARRPHGWAVVELAGFVLVAVSLVALLSWWGVLLASAGAVAVANLGELTKAAGRASDRRWQVRMSKASTRVARRDRGAA